MVDERLRQVPCCSAQAVEVLLARLALPLWEPFLLPPHDARYLLPQSVVANIEVGAPLGNLEHFQLSLALGCDALLRLEACRVVASKTCCWAISFS